MQPRVAYFCMEFGLHEELPIYAGGLGILVGDGRLPHPRPEQILETYYDWALLPQLHASIDYQYIRNPAYNGDRGPVSVFAIRMHTQR